MIGLESVQARLVAISVILKVGCRHVAERARLRDGGGRILYTFCAHRRCVSNASSSCISRSMDASDEAPMLSMQTCAGIWVKATSQG